MVHQTSEIRLHGVLGWNGMEYFTILWCENENVKCVGI